MNITLNFLIPEGLRAAQEGGLADIFCYISPRLTAISTAALKARRVLQEAPGRRGAALIQGAVAGVTATLVSLEVQSIAVAIIENSNFTDRYKFAIKFAGAYGGLYAGLFVGQNLVALTRIIMLTTMLVINIMSLALVGLERRLPRIQAYMYT